MNTLSEKSAVYRVFVAAMGSERIRNALCLFAAAFTALTLMLAPVLVEAQVPPTDATTAQMQVENQVNINTADAETLALALDGVGMAKAQDIIAYREQHGDFKTAEDLQNVRGIGKATFERNRDRILLETAGE